MSNSAITFNTGGLASATSPGLVGTSAQTFAGVKTFQDGIVAPTTAVGTIFSGTYTPSLFAGSGSPSGTPSLAQFARIGRVVIVSGIINPFSFNASANVEFALSLPINRTTNFTNPRGVGGSGVWCRGGVTTSVSFNVYTTAVTDRVTLFACTGVGVGTGDLFSYQFTYILD